MTERPEDEITKYIARFASPPAEQVREFAAAARTSLVAKGGFLVELGDASHPLYFVHSGAIRYMLIVPESGDDVTKDFSFAPAFAASFGSAVSGQPARVGIAAMTDCVVSSWPLQRLTAMYDVDAEWQKLGRKLAEWLYVRKEDREIAFLTQNPEQRYAELTRKIPELVAQVPQRHLASYLGITPESLSRLKARLAART
jgi:CRP-like cAMP-binding protein